MTGPTCLGAGAPLPLGASFDGTGINFALFSAHATRVELCLFDADGGRELERLTLPEHTDQVWHGRLRGGAPGQLYGYRVHGPYEPHHGHRFNPNKLLVDPYARALVGPLHWSDAHFGYRVDSARGDLSLDRRDNACGMPKCRVVDPAFSWGDDRPPAVPFEESVIYEVHVGGATMRHPDVRPALQGTYAGLSSGPMLEHLVRLGVTAVELLPVHAFVDDRHLVARGLRNYWGYNSLGFFAPEGRYAVADPVVEFKTMVARLHQAGIEVILDVVYNHTAEGNQLGPTLCFRGIDNASYYRLQADPRHYVDHTGCGNTLDVAHPRVLQLIMDSLRAWVVEMHVDGFRFDLATTLGRDPVDFDPGARFFDALRQDPVLNRVKLIAEPWDLGHDGYRLGRFPPGFAEWNDRYRKAVRGYWRGDEGGLSELATRLAGSSDLFEHEGRRPWASVNEVTCHDGFTLTDLVSYGDKHNEANGEGNQDGSDANLSCNHGVEGPTDDPAIQALRDRHKRNLLATLLLSQGTPMLLGGDEIGRTQQGNNNAYCQDNAISWLDWERADWDLCRFVGRLIRLRRAWPALRRDRFLHDPDALWYHPSGRQMTAGNWPNAECVGLLLASAMAGDGGEVNDPAEAQQDLLIVTNPRPDGVSFVLPATAADHGWRPLLDTALADGGPGPVAPAAASDAASDAPPQCQTHEVAGRSLVLFAGVAARDEDPEPSTTP